MICKCVPNLGLLFRRARLTRLFVFVFVVISIWSLCIQPSSPWSDHEPLEETVPLAWKHIHSFNNTEGAWHIPLEWIGDAEREPRTIIEAARLASELALSKSDRQMDYTHIPLLIHQTWKTTDITTWNTEITSWVEKWLANAISGSMPMAYFLWNDKGMRDLVQQYEIHLVDLYDSLTPVERSDVFRILVCKHFGGVYGDMDTEPLRHPANWVRRNDLALWTDPETGKRYGLRSGNLGSEDKERPVNIIWGIEADTDPGKDTYWRSGYEYPIQITQWAFASTPRHPILSRYMDNFYDYMSGNETTTQGDDPLARTGPAAVTRAAKSWLEDRIGFRWNSLTGLIDGGKSKLVENTLILPITSFSPGRGKWGNMGSRAITDPDARLLHHFKGSWRHSSLQVEYGKLCRTVFGLCRNWPKETG